MHNELAAAIKQHDNILLVAHASPDGDTIGSTCALFGALKAIGKRVAMACESPVPAVYSFFPYAREMCVGAEKLPFEPDCLVAVDCADLQRLGALQAVFARTKHTLNIDHHITNPGFADISWIEPDASSTGALVYKLINTLGVKMNPNLALCVFVAISTDTGHFSYSNTTHETFAVAAELAEYGLDMPYITNRLYRERTLLRTKLLGIALSRVELLLEGTVSVSHVTREELNAHGGAPDMEGMIELIRDIDSVETAVFFREKEKNLIKVSLRSKRCFDVGAFAARYGGGGHERAAGCTIIGPLTDVKEELLKQLLEAMVPMLEGQTRTQQDDAQSISPERSV